MTNISEKVLNVQTLDNNIFRELLSNCKKVSDNCIEQVILSAEYESEGNIYRLDFYGNKEADYKLLIEECKCNTVIGMCCGDAWTELVLSDIHKGILKRLLEIEVTAVKEYWNDFKSRFFKS